MIFLFRFRFRFGELTIFTKFISSIFNRRKMHDDAKTNQDGVSYEMCFEYYLSCHQWLEAGYWKLLEQRNLWSSIFSPNLLTQLEFINFEFINHWTQLVLSDKYKRLYNVPLVAQEVILWFLNVRKIVWNKHLWHLWHLFRNL